MTPMQWIVCEEGRRWAPALRMAAAARAWRGDMPVVEVRTLDELSARLAESNSALALVEIRRATASSRLDWLRSASRKSTHARFIALLDFAPLTDPAGRDTADLKARAHFAAACTEAGARGVIDSPRRLGPAIEIGIQHAARLEARQRRPLITGAFGAEEVWNALPWQDG